MDDSRDVPFEFRATGEDGLTFEGYAARFDLPTLINEPGRAPYREVIRPGAFRRSIGMTTPRFMFDHGRHPFWGTYEIGKITSLREDAKGLHVRARFVDTWFTDPLRASIADGVLAGMSFRFRPVKERWDRTGDMDTRELLEVACAELGPVSEPAYDGTSTSIRLAEAALEEVRSRLSDVLGVATTTDAARPEAPADDAPAMSTAPPSIIRRDLSRTNRAILAAIKERHQP